MNEQSRKQKIVELNDKLRTTMAGGKVLCTSDLAAKGPVFQIAAMALVSTFTDFNANNDPHGEHDFGQVDVRGTPVFWKIDYYDLDMTMHSPDEADESVTCRVLTLMLSGDL